MFAAQRWADSGERTFLEHQTRARLCFGYVTLARLHRGVFRLLLALWHRGKSECQGQESQAEWPVRRDPCTPAGEFGHDPEGCRWSPVEPSVTLCAGDDHPGLRQWPHAHSRCSISGGDPSAAPSVEPRGPADAPGNVQAGGEEENVVCISVCATGEEVGAVTELGTPEEEQV